MGRAGEGSRRWDLESWKEDAVVSSMRPTRRLWSGPGGGYGPGRERGPGHRPPMGTRQALPAGTGPEWGRLITRSQITRADCRGVQGAAGALTGAGLETLPLPRWDLGCGGGCGGVSHRAEAGRGLCREPWRLPLPERREKLGCLARGPAGPMGRLPGTCFSPPRIFPQKKGPEPPGFRNHPGCCRP